MSTQTLDIAYVTVEPTSDTPYRWFVQTRDSLGTVRYGKTYVDRGEAVAAAGRTADKLAAMGDYTVVRSFG